VDWPSKGELRSNLPACKTCVRSLRIRDSLPRGAKHLARAANVRKGLTSTPTAWCPNRPAETNVVPLPENGSSSSNGLRFRPEASTAWRTRASENPSLKEYQRCLGSDAFSSKFDNPRSVNGLSCTNILRFLSFLPGCIFLDNLRRSIALQENEVWLRASHVATRRNIRSRRRVVRVISCVIDH